MHCTTTLQIQYTCIHREIIWKYVFVLRNVSDYKSMVCRNVCVNITRAIFLHVYLLKIFCVVPDDLHMHLGLEVVYGKKVCMIMLEKAYQRASSCGQCEWCCQCWTSGAKSEVQTCLRDCLTKIPENVFESYTLNQHWPSQSWHQRLPAQLGAICLPSLGPSACLAWGHLPAWSVCEGKHEDICHRWERTTNILAIQS